LRHTFYGQEPPLYPPLSGHQNSAHPIWSFEDRDKVIFYCKLKHTMKVNKITLTKKRACLALYFFFKSEFKMIVTT